MAISKNEPIKYNDIKYLCDIVEGVQFANLLSGKVSSTRTLDPNKSEFRQGYILSRINLHITTDGIKLYHDAEDADLTDFGQIYVKYGRDDILGFYNELKMYSLTDCFYYGIYKINPTVYVTLFKDDTLDSERYITTCYIDINLNNHTLTLKDMFKGCTIYIHGPGTVVIDGAQTHEGKISFINCTVKFAADYHNYFNDIFIDYTTKLNSNGGYNRIGLFNWSSIQFHPSFNASNVVDPGTNGKLIYIWGGTVRCPQSMESMLNKIGAVETFFF